MDLRECLDAEARLIESRRGAVITADVRFAAVPSSANADALQTALKEYAEIVPWSVSETGALTWPVDEGGP